MSSEHTSDIQLRMYDFIVKYMRDEGMPPTNREIGSALNIASTGHVDYHLSMLEKKGYITRQSKNSRGIRLVEDPFGIPVMGSIAAGEPLEVFSDSSEAIEVGRDIEQQGTYALVVKGQSMIEDHICDKDYLIIKPQSRCENGDIVVAVHLIGNGRATLRRFFQDNDRARVVLLPANSETDPIYVPKSEWDNEWQVQGKVVAIFRKLLSRSDAISLILDALLPYTTIGMASINKPESTIAKHAIDSSEIENLKKLIKEKVSPLNKANYDQVFSKYSEDPVKWREALEEELIELKVDDDKQIIDEARLILEYKIKQQNTVTERIVTSANSTRSQLNKISELGLIQANRWYQYSLGVAALGFIIIIFGIGLIYFTDKITIGILTTIAGIIPEIAAALVFQQARDANKRLDDFYNKLIELEGFNKAFEITLTTSEENQDHYKGLIISRYLGLHIKEDKV